MHSDLSSLGLLCVGGDLDAKKLLQGQLTCNLEAINEEVPQLGALCNPQGRVISLFYLFLQQSNYYLLMPSLMVALTINSLKKYSVFYKKVSLTNASNEITLIHAIQEKIGIGADWQLKLIEAGIPMIYPETSEKFLPHELNLPALHAVSFEKGCYTGQEIIARMHYRGKLKTHLYQANIHSTDFLLPGMPVFYKQDQMVKECGTLINAYLIGNNDYSVLLVTDDMNAKNQHLFSTDTGNYFIIK